MLSQESKCVNVKSLYLWVWTSIHAAGDKGVCESDHSHMSRMANGMKGESRHISYQESLCGWAARLDLDRGCSQRPLGHTSPTAEWGSQQEARGGVGLSF